MRSASYSSFGLFRRKPASRFGSGLLLYLLSGFFTLLLFVGLPFLEKLARTPVPDTGFRTVDTIDLPVLPQPPELSRVNEPYRNPLPQPQLNPVTPQLQPMPVNMDLTMLPVEPRGDFSVDFDVMDADLVQQVGALIFEPGELDNPPQPQVCMQPVYPPRARMRRQEGFVEVEFVVDREGVPGDIRVIQSMPPQTFDQSTLRAIKGWRFSPGIKNGQPVATRVRQKISFTLE